MNNVRLLPFLIMILFSLGLTACFPKDPNQLERISEARALEIAAEDAASVYPDLSLFEVTIDTVGTRWKIDYLSTDTAQAKEGPHYLVARRGGKIIMKHYPR